MNYVSIGDMSQAYQLRRHQATLKSNLSQLTEEVATGLRKDVGAAVRGDFTALSGIEGSLKALASYDLAGKEGAQLASAMQTSLGAIQTQVSGLGATLASAAASASTTMISATTADAKGKFFGAVAALNTDTAGRHLFSGNATDTPPVVPADQLLAFLQAEIAGLTTVQDVVASVDAWFDAPAGGGGYLDLAYRGSDPLAPIAIGEDDTVELSVTAADPAIRGSLKGLALAALVAEGQFAGDLPARSHLTQIAGERILTADGTLSTLRAEVGTAEKRIEDATARNSAAVTSLELARGALVSVDPYRTATALQEAQTQLETLYLLTARLSQLSLADYLR